MTVFDEKQLLKEFDDIEDRLQKDLSHRARFNGFASGFAATAAVFGVAFFVVKLPILLLPLVGSGIGFGISKIISGWNDDRISHSYSKQASIVSRIEDALRGMKKGPANEQSLTAEASADFSTAARLQKLEETVTELSQKAEPKKIKIDKSVR